MGAAYRQYPQEVKDEIARTGNIYLFPSLNIPRTTAQYWANKTYLKVSENRRDNIKSLYDQKVRFLEDELRKEKVLRELVQKNSSSFSI